MTTMRKWARRLALLAVPLALAIAGVMLPATAALAWTTTVVFNVQPTTTQVNTAMMPAVVVQVDSNGQVDQGYNGPVTLTYADDPIGAPELAGSTVNADQGVATFSDLTFSAVGFGFELQASIPGDTTSAESAPFNIVTQLVQCQPDRPCRSESVSSAGTSGSVTAVAARTSDVLTATGGGSPSLACTKYGGVLNFSVTNRAKVITLTLDRPPSQDGPFGICWASPTPFITASNQVAGFNAASNEYEGLLPYCYAHGPSPCIKRQTRKCRGPVVTTIDAPPGDPYVGY